MDSLKNFVSDDFGKAIFTVAGTLLVTGFGVWLGAFKELFTDWWRRRRQARYHAMLLAVTLDQLVDDCMTAAFDDGIADQEGERVTTSANPAIVWPDALDWPLLNTEVMYRCLLLPGWSKAPSKAWPSSRRTLPVRRTMKNISMSASFDMPLSGSQRSICLTASKVTTA
ncbi:hypothetical protein [Rhizobium sp. BG4]|uniref:hypothetical protein n=1 Tax=Rhizobium sp. BG4 TaxID=2613770 RepID=UPI00193D3681|nr:hypothetical protein [Rhizobium sp. BG4]QRM45138.1 hypothetical protein F2982_17870 [Rhizobium sp. BG4]